MEFQFILGVDISKEWFNFCQMNHKFEIIWEGQIENKPDVIFKFLTEFSHLLPSKDLNEVILCLEHTGIYVQHLVRCWLSKGGHLCLIPAPQISEHLSGQNSFEEKTDHLDARRIAEYGIRFEDKLHLWQAKSHTLEQLQRFQRQRQKFISAINMLEVPVNESQLFDSTEIGENLKSNQAASLGALKEDLKSLEKQLDDLIENDAQLSNLFKLIISVQGIGKVTAREILITTAGFTRFSPNQAKSYARYAGIIPLKKESGKSVRKRNKTSKRANGRIKTLLTMGAQSVIGTKSELAIYYYRKRAEGKNHLVVINALRNKLILRVFAVVRNQVTYQKNNNICLD